MGILILFAAQTDQTSGAEHVEVSGRVLGKKQQSELFPRNAAPKILNGFCITADFVFLWFVCFANFDADKTHDW